MRDSSPRKRSLDCLIDYVHNVSWAHHPLVVGGYIHEKLVQIHILLVMRADQIVERVPGNRQHSLPARMSRYTLRAIGLSIHAIQALGRCAAATD